MLMSSFFFFLGKNMISLITCHMLFNIRARDNKPGKVGGSYPQGKSVKLNGIKLTLSTILGNNWLCNFPSCFADCLQKEKGIKVQTRRKHH